MARGFTLIEVVVALSLVLVGGLAALRLMARTEHTVSIARQKFIALQVAREGIELVRAIRDTNWFKSEDPTLQDWAASLCPDENPNRSFTLDAKRVRNFTGVVGDVDNHELYIQSKGEWTHEVSSNPSGYSRLLTVDCTQKNNDPAFITVTSRVDWTLDGIKREVDIKEKLFNWYIAPTV